MALIVAIMLTGGASFLLGAAGLAVMALPIKFRRLLTTLADMTPGQLRFIGLFASLTSLILLAALLLFIKLEFY